MDTTSSSFNPDTSLSQSLIHTWTACQYQAHLVYNRKLRPRRDKPALSVGSVGHAVLAALLTHQSAEEAVEKWQKAAFAASQAWTDDDLAEIQRLCELGYALAVRAFKNLDIGHKWTTVEFDGKPMVEYRFSLPVSGLGMFDHFSGVVDWVARNHDGNTFLIDHKFRKALQPSDSEEHNLQMTTYQRLLGKAGIKAHGSISHQIRTELPKTPKTNKDGSISRAYILTDWATYSAAVVAAGRQPDDYAEEMIPKLAEVEFFRMSEAYRGQVEIDNVWDAVVPPIAQDITASKNKAVYPRTVKHMTCKSCFVRDYCWAELRGLDTKFLEQTQFIVGGSSKPEAFNHFIIDADEEE